MPTLETIQASSQTHTSSIWIGCRAPAQTSEQLRLSHTVRAKSACPRRGVHVREGRERRRFSRSQTGSIIHRSGLEAPTHLEGLVGRSKEKHEERRIDSRTCLTNGVEKGRIKHSPLNTFGASIIGNNEAMVQVDKLPLTPKSLKLCRAQDENKDIHQLACRCPNKFKSRARVLNNFVALFCFPNLRKEPRSPCHTQLHNNMPFRRILAPDQY
jgi:hypothetical protein